MKRVILALGTCISQHAMNGIKIVPECNEKFDFEYIFGTVDRVSTPIPDDILRRVALIIQDLGPWQSATHLLKTEAELIPSDAVTINIPTLHFNSLWPFLAVDPRNKPTEQYPWGRYPAPWTDRIAIEAVRAHSTMSDRLTAYYSYDVAKNIDLDHFHNTQIVNMFIREQNADLKIAAIVATLFQKTRLYHEHHHPSGELMVHLMAQIYGNRKFTSLHRGSIPAMISHAKYLFSKHDPFSLEQVPIHPAVARHFNLDWWTEDMNYQILGRSFTFDSWVKEYLEEDILESVE